MTKDHRDAPRRCESMGGLKSWSCGKECVECWTHLEKWKADPRWAIGEHSEMVRLSQEKMRTTKKKERKKIKIKIRRCISTGGGRRDGLTSGGGRDGNGGRNRRLFSVAKCTVVLR